MSAPLHNETLKAIETKLGRPLRVLHIGNIANNAYNNARIQRQYGIEADVLSYDYYHVMSTPEWEDAAFEGEVNPDAPNWWATSLKGWKRPDWFVQGPAAGCLQYLRARHLGLGHLQSLLWRYLEACCLEQVLGSEEASGKPIQQIPAHLQAAVSMAVLHRVTAGPSLAFDVETIEKVRTGLLLPRPILADMGEKPLTFPRLAAREAMLHAKALYRCALDATILPRARSGAHDDMSVRLWLKWQSKRHGGLSHDQLLAMYDEGASGRAQLRALSPSMTLATGRNMARLLASRSVLALKMLRGLHVLANKRALSEYFGQASEKRRLMDYFRQIDTSARDHDAPVRLAAMADHFKDAPQTARQTFFDFHTGFQTQFFDLMDKYDVVQGYSIDGGICWTNGLARFVSYEHGTLRDLPFGQDFYGIVTRIAYHASTFSFVTNSDVMPATERMGLDPARVICLPHAFDDRKLMRFRDENPDLEPPSGPPVIFSPTRQHWKDKSGSWTKGNDILLHAAAIIAREGHDFRLHLVAWGKEVEDSKALIAELGIADKVVWLAPMQKRELWRAYCTAHAVADQFILPALGGVGFETMALARRLITAIDEAQVTRFFGECPPCLSTATIETCVERLRQVITDRDDKAGLGLAAQRWMRERHSAERIVDIQAQTYWRFLNEDTASAPREVKVSA